MYSNSKVSHPFVGMKRPDDHQTRFMEDMETAKEMGLDVGDYAWIDEHLTHCPTIDWLRMGMVNPKVKN